MNFVIHNTINLSKLDFKLFDIMFDGTAGRAINLSKLDFKYRFLYRPEPLMTVYKSIQTGF